VPDHEVSSASAPVSRPRSVFARLAPVLRYRPNVLLVVALVWFAAALYAVLWTWGLDPLVFPAPDEAVVRYAADLIRKHQAPFLALPVADPEDLFHPRSWITLGDKAWPSYAPVSFYVYGWILRAHTAGLLLVAALPASAVSAFSAGVGLLLPRPRRWLSLLAPAMAFPATYWLLRPWVNMSPLLIGVCWCLLFWAQWRVTERAGWLVAALVCLGFSAAVRPDYAAYLFVVALLFTVAARPQGWKLTFALVVSSGVLALAANMLLNKLITGHALRAAYQVAVDRQWGPEPDHQIPGLGMLHSLLVPMGLPTLRVFATTFSKYWLHMGPVALLLFGQLALVPLVLRGSRFSCISKAAGVLVILFFVASRLQDAVYGALVQHGEMQHSVPRYLAPVYLVSVLPPLLFLGWCRKRLVLVVGAAALAVLAASGGYQVWTQGSASLRFINGYVQDKQYVIRVLSRTIPSDATVYTASEDKWLWSRWRVCVIENDGATASSIARALEANLKVFVVQPGLAPQIRHLAAALKRKHISLVRVDASRGVYRVDR
jgi:hypothetical protein